MKTYFTISDDLTRVVMQNRIFFISNRLSENYFWRIFGSRLYLRINYFWISLSQKIYKFSYFSYLIEAPSQRAGLSWIIKWNNTMRITTDFDPPKTHRPLPTQKIKFSLKFRHKKHGSDSFQIHLLEDFVSKL